MCSQPCSICSPFSPTSGTAATEGPVTAFTLIHGIPGREDDLRAHLLSLTAPTRAEAGCLAYDLYQHPERKHEFLRFEVWSGREALEAHKKSPHLRASFEKRQREGWTTEIVLWNRTAPCCPERCRSSSPRS